MCKDVYGYVYMVRNKINGKIYFGITVNDFHTRYSSGIEHTHNEHLSRSIKKYGIENFEINEKFDIAYSEDDLWDLEDMYMCIYNTLDPKYGYNKRRSGSKYKGHGKASDESKKKMSKSQKALYEQGYVNPMHGKLHTEESRKKMSDSKKGKYCGEDSPHYGVVKTEKHKNKISKTKKEYYKTHDAPFKGKLHTEESRKKMSEAHKGIKATDETKQKLRKAKSGINNPMYGKDFGGENNPNAKSVICLETKQIFTTIKDAKQWCGGDITQHLKGRSKSAGKHPITNEKLHWMYYNKYLELNNNDDELDSSNIKIA